MSEERTRDLPSNRSFEERLFSRLDAMDSRFELMDSRFDAVETRFDAVETRFDAVETRFDAMETRLDRRFDGVDTRLQALEAKALDTKPIWENALAEIVAVKENVQEVKGRVENIERKFELLIIDMMQLRGDQRRVDKRMDALEFSPQ